VTLLLDAHTLLWWLADDRRLAKPAKEAIADRATVVYVSAVTAWEIAIKRTLGKLWAPDDLEDQMRANGLTELGISVADGLLAGALPLHHADPFDRMLVAQAQRRGLTIVTRDEAIRLYGVPVLGA
jgi:PIN domain nuclease of toxin-antitoxin system